MAASSPRDVFINCPFDDEFEPGFRALVLDIDRHRFAKFISDIAGMDITPHNNDPRAMVGCVRNWLLTATRRKSIPSPALLLASFDRFSAGLPAIAHAAGLDAATLLYPDYERLVLGWVRTERDSALLPKP